MYVYTYTYICLSACLIVCMCVCLKWHGKGEFCMLAHITRPLHSPHQSIQLYFMLFVDTYVCMYLCVYVDSSKRKRIFVKGIFLYSVISTYYLYCII